MRELVCLNHKILLASEAFLPAASAAAFYGGGVFTTLAIWRGKPFQTDKHWQRLKKDAARLNLDLSGFKEDEIETALKTTIAANNLTDGRARITFFDRSLKGVWNSQAENKTAFLIVAAENRFALRDLRLSISPYPVNSRSPLAGVKSCNYLENMLALENAKNAGFDEAIRINEHGDVVSACLANIFWVKNGRLFTPSLDTGALAGTTRAFIAENFPVIERRARIEDFNEADEIFLTSAGVFAARVRCFGKIKYDEAIVFEQVFKRIWDVAGI